MSSPSPSLRSGARVHLRHPLLTDADEFLALRRASEAFHKPWEPAPPEGVEPFSPETFAAFLAGSLAPNRERLLICRNEDDRILGSVNLSEIVRGAFLSAYVGYWIGADFARQGYMTEALRLATEYAFETLGLHRVEANIRPENVASIALVKGLGFAKEGFSPRYLKIAGEWRDHERWALLSDEKDA